MWGEQANLQGALELFGPAKLHLYFPVLLKRQQPHSWLLSHNAEQLNRLAQSIKVNENQAIAINVLPDCPSWAIPLVLFHEFHCAPNNILNHR